MRSVLSVLLVRIERAKKLHVDGERLLRRILGKLLVGPDALVVRLVVARTREDGHVLEKLRSVRRLLHGGKPLSPFFLGSDEAPLHGEPLCGLPGSVLEISGVENEIRVLPARHVHRLDNLLLLLQIGKQDETEGTSSRNGCRSEGIDGAFRCLSSLCDHGPVAVFRSRLQSLERRDALEDLEFRILFRLRVIPVGFCGRAQSLHFIGSRLRFSPKGLRLSEFNPCILARLGEKPAHVHLRRGSQGDEIGFRVGSRRKSRQPAADD